MPGGAGFADSLMGLFSSVRHTDIIDKRTIVLVSMMRMILLPFLVLTLLSETCRSYQYGQIRSWKSSPKSFLKLQSSFKEDLEKPKVESKDLRNLSPLKEGWMTDVAQHLVFLAPIVTTLLIAEPAFADGEAINYGILAGRTASLIHPFTNFALFGTSIYSGYLGLQWRRLRDIGEELKSLTNNLPKLTTVQAKFPLAERVKELNTQLTTLSGEGAENQQKILQIQKDLSILNQFQELDVKYTELTETRKNLLTGNFRDKHFLTGSILLGAGVTVSILGAFNTFMRAGRLFPGPHLFAGMAITILWAVAASLVPAMQKGNEAARIAHITLNVINVALFAWQIPTGIEILLKVVEKTSWP